MSVSDRGVMKQCMLTKVPVEARDGSRRRTDEY